MTDSAKNHELLLELKTQQDRIWKEIAGDEELNRQGMVKDIADLKREVAEIKAKGIRIKLFWMGATSAASFLTGLSWKTLWAKIIALFSALPR